MTYLSSKASLRRQAAVLVGALPPERRRRAESAIVEYIVSLPAYRAAEQLLAYRALADEVALEGVLARAEADGKSLYLPAVRADGSLVFRRWSIGDALEVGESGVEVPPGGDPPAQRMSLALIPGRAFDRRGCRVGRGLGCYDRVLDDLAGLGPTVGVAYACQVFASVPCERHDRSVDLLVTEDGIMAQQWPRQS